MLSVDELDKLILRIPDYPKSGVVFQDITPLLAHPEGFHSLIQNLTLPFKEVGITHVVGIEARGFLVASAMAYLLGAGLVPARKVGKLPRKTHSQTYDLEYGTSTIELHSDAISSGAKVLLVDDVLATGGTLLAVTKILEILDVKVMGIAVISEITALEGRAKLGNINIHSLIK